MSLNQLADWCDGGRGRYRLELERGADGAVGYRCEVWWGRVHEIGSGETPEEATLKAVSRAKLELTRWAGV